jgi:hypothetical protein
LSPRPAEGARRAEPEALDVDLERVEDLRVPDLRVDDARDPDPRRVDLEPPELVAIATS